MKYLDKYGIEREVVPIHFGPGVDERVVSARRWWHYLWQIKAEDQPKYIQQWYEAGLLTDAQLWDVLGSFGSPVSMARAVEIYESLGFVPHAGYPLVRR